MEYCYCVLLLKMVSYATTQTIEYSTLYSTSDISLNKTSSDLKTLTTSHPPSTKDSIPMITEFAEVNVSLLLNDNDLDALLKKENETEAKSLIPVTIYLILLMIIGVIGNTIVVYIYKFRFKRSTSRIFILSLAAFDLVTCLLGMPYHIIDMIYPFMFVWNTLCKVLSFALTFTILASIFVLDLIAIDRYRKICTPFNKQLSSRGSHVLSWMTVILSLVCAVPTLLVYGSAEVPIGRFNLTGHECYISDDYIESYFPLIYSAFTFLLFFGSVFILIGFYGRVGYTIWARRSFNDWSRGNEFKRSTSSTPSTSVLQLNAITDEAKSSPMLARFSKDKEEGIVHIFDSYSNTPVSTPKDDSPTPYRATTTGSKQKERTKFNKKLFRLMSEASSTSGDNETTTSERGSSRSQGSHRHHVTKKQKRTIRITGMLFVITLIFIISFLPYLTIQIVNELNETLWSDMTVSENVLFNFLLRTYFVNSMINPIVYWFLDHKFKDEVVKLFHDIRHCTISTRFRWSQKSFHS